MAVDTNGVNVMREQVASLTTEGQPKCVAKYSLGFTINLGNYESAKIECGIELEGTVDKLDALQTMAQEVVEDSVQGQISEIKGLKNPNETLLRAFSK